MTDKENQDVRQILIDLANWLPGGSTIEDARYHLHVIDKINKGLKDAEEGRLIDHAEVVAKWEKKRQRITGLSRGKGWMADDFDDELGDEFWFGDDEGE